jgi:hypothetical protein
MSGQINTGSKAKIQIENGQTLKAMAALSDSGDQLTFETAASLLSNVAGKEPDIRPDGLITGGAVIPEVGLTNDQVDVAAATAYQAGVKETVGASTGDGITRASTADYYMVNSITVDNAQAIAVVTGTEGVSLSTTRDGNGGPPLIPTDSIEIAQVITKGNVAAPISADEIFDTPNQHQERYDYPTFSEDMANGNVVFDIALSKIHTGVIPKQVFGKVYDPIFTDLVNVTNFKAPEVTHSVSSEQIYGKAVGASSESIGQGGFNAKLKDGLSDTVVKLKGMLLWFKFFPNKYDTPHLPVQGKFGISRSWPADGVLNAECTISASEEGTEVLT